MKKLILLFTIIFLSVNLNAGILQQYRKAKRDINTTKEILGIDKKDTNNTSTNTHTTFKEAVPGLIILSIPILLITFFVIRYKKKEKRKKIEEAEQLELRKNQILVLLQNNENIKKYNIEYNIDNFTNIYNLNKYYEEIIDKINALINKEKWEINLLLKYGENIGRKLINEEYFVGMSIEQLIDSKGNPTQIETEVLKTKTKEIYIYGNKSSGDVFTFVNGVCERFKDR